MNKILFRSIYITLLICLVLVLTGCSGKQTDNKDLVYEDMQSAFMQSGLLSSNIAHRDHTGRFLLS